MIHFVVLVENGQQLTDLILMTCLETAMAELQLGSVKERVDDLTSEEYLGRLLGRHSGKAIMTSSK